MDENARKRKRETEDNLDEGGVAAEKALEGPKPAAKKSKKEKKKKEREVGEAKQDKAAADTAKSDENATTVQKAQAEKRKLKMERKKAKAESKAAKKEVKRAKKEQAPSFRTIAHELESDKEDVNPVTGDMDQIEIEGITVVSEAVQSSTASSSPRAESLAFDAPPAQSGSSSISSIAPTVSEDTKPKEPKESLKNDSTTAKTSDEPKIPPDELRARLMERINALRAARKAEGSDGQPARTRQELMEARRLQDAKQKAHKKKLRQQAKEEEQRKHQEMLARGSPLLSGSPLISPRAGSNALNPPAEPSNNFSFGRIAFGNGQQASAQLNDITSIRNPKGPSDPATALDAAKRREAHLASLDDNKRADIQEKDMWLNARKHAHGERVRDDSSLLKKTLKRKEKQKEKSKKEWTERIEGIKKSQNMKQKRREESLQKRKDEKGGKGKPKGKPKQKPRPGFEGSFRARHNNKKQ